ncbi:hypothetical protein [Streptomyces sp. WAC01526]|uniref:hypothetical protein n=1 Tax=Streptomyces sp. WAC01526 TaxID=2588709 RepID=UPI0011E00F95|nr:hypothetical protein [Streptomyces sp. WAC01526]
MSEKDFAERVHTLDGAGMCAGDERFGSRGIRLWQEVSRCKNYVKVWRSGGKVYAYAKQTCNKRVLAVKPTVALSANGGKFGFVTAGKACKFAKTCKTKKVSLKAKKGRIYRASNSEFLPALRADLLEGLNGVSAAVLLTNGAYHEMDSSDYGYRIAGQEAGRAALIGTGLLPPCEAETLR